ncbi:hypothetical protein BATDEDRAFT_85801 [Batrachochytrium dendrobatidis JAM81]|uniref:rRNA adenine N(6)-methyltransferase n=1 Tax=Batrachochytrium dendrobatidis (strain JAM81 / FGSC 10211) TaxID=684364 RepID=F4NUM6_BATDJ|nr:uncharacterized protein BATDEDRAFT_85801 [Batrachochytrium dendrobatidis JAM81]EGF83198.1 hypothetical protein BATDEDRAFT_85801 [Batrachochytrium dendrobatidis JAM81]KAK5671580.1 hypothetical protein QVD99_001427 [Batrachochytrium dendrobatidis]|eukprot:XP_006676016.1 hypothetical protein BATDEDRAFT_85801 [Batrachochytrium dendrobatidis JAM81]
MALPKLPQLISIYNVHAKKALGQNFLLRPGVTDSIAQHAVAKKRDGKTLHVEVGPGPGGLTRSLLKLGVTHLVAVEKDASVAPMLQILQASVPSRFRFLLGDMLESDQQVLFNQIMTEAVECDRLSQPNSNSNPDNQPHFDKVHIVGNLPYSISSPLLHMWIKQAATEKYLFSFPKTEMTLMLQREVCERIAAPVGTKVRGRLSVLCQAFFDVKMLSVVDRKLFRPVPKVDGGILQFKPHAENRLKDVPYETFAHLVKVLHHHPNSMIRAILKRHNLGKVIDVLTECGIDPTSRSFMVDVDSYIRLARRCTHDRIQLNTAVIPPIK